MSVLFGYFWNFYGLSYLPKELDKFSANSPQNLRRFSTPVENVHGKFSLNFSADFIYSWKFRNSRIPQVLLNFSANSPQIFCPISSLWKGDNIIIGRYIIYVVLNERQIVHMKEMQDKGMSISAIAREMRIDRKTVIKYISRIKEQEEKGKKTIKQIEIEERTKMIGMKEAEHTTEKYLEFRDEIDEYMTKLLQLRWKYDAYITEHKVTFVDLVETALKEYVENTKNRMNVREFLGNLIMVKALEKT